MSEKREGWLGWERPSTKERWVREKHSEVFGYTRPVLVQPLDPDGPKPGETWEYKGDPVTIGGPRAITLAGEVASWWASADGTGWFDVAHDLLDPIPRTRTVTVELTEEDVAKVKRFANGPSPQDFLRKLAEALEDS